MGNLECWSGTSCLAEQVYQEVTDNGNPVVMILEVDITRLLIERGYTTDKAVDNWLDATGD